MKLLNSIRDEVREEFGFYVYDDESVSEVYDFLNEYYPGPIWTVWCSEAGDLFIDADFKTEQEEVFYILKWSGH